MKKTTLTTGIWSVIVCLVAIFSFLPAEVLAELPQMKPPSGGDTSDIFATTKDWTTAIMEWMIYILGGVVILGVAYALFTRYMSWATQQDREGLGGLLLAFAVGIVIIVVVLWLLNLGLETIKS